VLREAWAKHNKCSADANLLRAGQDTVTAPWS
jgi:hypothetical protein